MIWKICFFHNLHFNVHDRGNPIFLTTFLCCNSNPSPVKLNSKFTALVYYHPKFPTQSKPFVGTYLNMLLTGIDWLYASSPYLFIHTEINTELSQDLWRIKHFFQFLIYTKLGHNLVMVSGEKSLLPYLEKWVK